MQISPHNDDKNTTDIGDLAVFASFSSPERQAAKPLVIVINSYLEPSRLQLSDIFSTRLEYFNHIRRKDCNALWIAESKRNWYLAHEHKVMNLINNMVLTDQPSEIILVGMSAGGYLGGRLAYFLSLRGSCRVTAYAINPQTGFRPKLIEKINKTVETMPRFKDQLGRNPIILNVDLNRSETFSLITKSNPGVATDWNEFFSSDHAHPQNLLISYHFDRANPIEAQFAEDVGKFSFVRLMPLDLGIQHAAGCTHLGGLFCTNDLLHSWHGIRQLPGGQVQIITHAYHFVGTNDLIVTKHPGSSIDEKTLLNLKINELMSDPMEPIRADSIRNSKGGHASSEKGASLPASSVHDASRGNSCHLESPTGQSWKVQLPGIIDASSSPKAGTSLSVKPSQVECFTHHPLDINNIRIYKCESASFQQGSISEHLASANHDSTLEELYTEAHRSLGSVCALDFKKLFSTAYSWSRRDQGGIDCVDDIDASSPYNSSEKNNLAWLKDNLSHWVEVYHSGSYLLVAEQEGEFVGIEALGTVLISEHTGSVLVYPFLLNSILVAPIYSASKSQLVAILFYESTQGQAALIVDNRLPFSRDSTQKDIVAVVNGINSLINDARTNVELCKDYCERNSYHILVGQRRNFGHNLINDSYCLHIIKSALDHGDTCNIMLGSHDFFSTLQLINDYVAFTGCTSNLSLDATRSYLMKDNLYTFLRKTVYTVPTYLPVQSSLNFLRGSYKSKGSEDRQCLQSKKTFYIACDNRGGGRRWKNFHESFDAIMQSAVQNSIDCVVLDGLTFCPVYELVDDQVRVTGSATNIYPEDFLDYARQLASKCGLQILCIDGLSMPEKSDCLRDLHIVKAVAPYGAGAAFPIYILNAPIALVGSEWAGARVSTWHWWVGKYCHSQRFDDSLYISSLSFGQNGYVVDSTTLIEFFNDNP